MEEQPLDLRATLGAVWRYKVVVVLLALLGAGAGVVYTSRTTPMPEARSVVLLPPNAITGSPGQSPYTVTQQIIAKSTPVLAGAGSSVLPPLSAAALAQRVAVTAPSQDVMEITVRASSTIDAERLANAVATGYIAYVAKTANGSAALLSTLQREAASLTHTILALQSRIDAAQIRLSRERATSQAAQRDSLLLNTLRTEQEQASIQLDNVNTQVVNAELTTAQATSATQLLQRAQPVPPSGTVTPLAGGLGGLAGVLAGAVLALALGSRDRRLRSRSAIATAIGVPVVASLWARRCSRVSEWRRLLVESRNLSAVEVWNSWRALQQVGPGTPTGRCIDLVLFARDSPAAAAAIKLVAGASLLGMEVDWEVGEHEALRTLRAALASQPGAHARSVGARGDGTGGAGAGRSGGIRIRMEAVDGIRPQVSAGGPKGLLLVSSGFVTALDLARLALAAADAGRQLCGVVVVNPDRGDASSGLVAMPQGMQTVSGPGQERVAVPGLAGNFR